MKTSFVTRYQGEKNKSGVVDAQKIIEHFLSLDPQNRVIPDSPLYNLAVNQYNTNVKNKTERSAVPKWFCGKVDPTTSELVPVPTDDSLRGDGGFILDPPRFLESTGVPTLSSYAIDHCLELGTPGSYEYSLCTSALTLDQLSTSGINWIANIGRTHVEPSPPPDVFAAFGVSERKPHEGFWDKVGGIISKGARWVKKKVKKAKKWLKKIF